MTGLLSSSLKQLKTVKARRNFFKGSVTIKAKRKDAVAKILSGPNTLYAAPDGLLFKDEALPKYDALPALQISSQNAGDILPQKIVKLFSELNEHKALGIKRIDLRLNPEQAHLLLTDGTTADMGSLDDVHAKLNALGVVLKSAKSRSLKAPYNINLNYFYDDKIYLTENQNG